LGGEVLNITKEERDLGVIVTDNFKLGKQFLKASKKANQSLDMIRRTFVSHKMEIIIPL